MRTPAMASAAAPPGGGGRVVLLASPGVGHLFPLTELARHLAVRHRLGATLLTFSDLSTPAQSAFLASLPDFITSMPLPPVPLDDIPADSHVASFLCGVVRRSLPNIRVALDSIRDSSGDSVVAFIPDILATGAIGVAAELGIPSYIFYTSSLLSLSTAFHLPEMHEAITGEFRDLAEPVRLPGCIPLRGEDLTESIQDRTSQTYAFILAVCRSYLLADGVLVNGFDELEPLTAAALKDGEGGRFPPVVVVGPFVRSGSDDADEARCLDWLSRQPPGSVLLVSLGSGGTLSLTQTHELAHGLEMSGRRFLWAVHPPSDTTASGVYFGGGHGTDPAAWLPEGFVARTRGLGMATAAWIPQASVLQHRAVGGFMTHCGWNSVLEAVSNGVPMIAWPLYNEQRMNAQMLVEAARVALRPKEEARGVVAREAVKEVVEALMVGGGKGEAVRRRARELKAAAERAMAPAGLSSTALDKVAAKWLSS